MKLRNYFISAFVPAFMAFAMVSCTESGTDNGGDEGGNGDKPAPEEKSDAAEITAFTLTAGDVVMEGVIYDQDKVVELVCMPLQFAAIEKATATIEISEGATISPDPTVEANYADLDNPVKFTVTAEDGTTTNEYTVEAVEATVVVRSEQLWQKAAGALEMAAQGGDGETSTAVAFSGLDIVEVGGKVYDLEGAKIGDLNKAGAYDGAILWMTNDEKGCLVASVKNPETGFGGIFAWLDGWANVPTKIYEATDGDVTRYMTVAGDVKDGQAVLSIIGPSRGEVQMYHVFNVNKHDFTVEGAWNGGYVSLMSADGNWGQMFGPASGDINGTFFVYDSRGNNEGAQIFARQGLEEGNDVALFGTVGDDALAEGTGSSQYGNLSIGHMRPFMWNGDAYVVAATSGWDAAYITIQPADPNQDYIMRTQRIEGYTVPVGCAAYVYDAENELGYVVYGAFSHGAILYKIYNEVI